ncbi:MAG: hypothetical protein WCC37_04995, partial [Candidatus Sulfotelmatobacter sp.]
TVTPQSTDPKPSCSDFSGPSAPPAGPINYRQQAQSNSQKSLPSLYQAFKTGGTQDFKGNSALATELTKSTQEISISVQLWLPWVKL